MLLGMPKWITGKCIETTTRLVLPQKLVNTNTVQVLHIHEHVLLKKTKKMLVVSQKWANQQKWLK